MLKITDFSKTYKGGKKAVSQHKAWPNIVSEAYC